MRRPSPLGVGRAIPAGLSPQPQHAGSWWGGIFTVSARIEPGYRSPPRSKWALKKFSEPEVAIDADAEISSASVAAATICAKR